MKNLGRLNIQKTLFFNCDIQQGFAKHILGMKSVETTAIQMGQVAQLLEIPTLVTEQNTRVFGNTIEAIKNSISTENSQLFEKSTFSMINDDTLKYINQFKERKSVVLYGVETHVCVQQTFLDLKSLGYDVHLLMDGVSSIKNTDRKASIRRMENEGAFITTSQSVIFELLKTHEHPQFKSILNILKMPKSDQLDDI